MTPSPHIRADAVGHYAALLGDNTLPSVALCIAVVRGLPVPEAFTRYDAFPGPHRTTIADAGQASVSAYPDPLPIVVADDCADWTVLVEDNGYHASRAEVLSRLSRGTVAASVYWNVNMVSRISYAADGRLLASFDFVLGEPPQGEDPGRIAPFLHGLTFDDPDRDTAEALAFLERVSAVRITRDWLVKPHPASVIVPADEFGPRNLGPWLEHTAPAIAAAVPHASQETLRAAATLAATSVVRALGVDGLASHRDQLLASARGAYRQALELRWERCRPMPEPTDPVARLRARRRLRRTPSDQERAMAARAYAIGAAYARLADDPIDGLHGALANAFKADQDHWPDLRDRVGALLGDRA